MGARPAAALPYLVLAVAVLAVSGGAIFVRYAAAPALAIAAWRLVMASAIVVPLVLAQGRLRAETPRRAFVLAAAAGGLLALHFATWISSLSFTSVANSVLLVNTAPVWVALMALAIGREPPPGRTWVAVALTIGGGLIIALGDAAGPGSLKGNLLAVAGAIAMAGYLLLARAAQHSLPFLPYVALAYGTAAVVLWLAVAGTGVEWHGFSATTWGALAAMAVVSQVVGHGGYNWSLRHLQPAFVAVALTAEPVLAALLAWLLLGEGIGWATAAGGLLLLIGIAVAATAPRR